jgi:Regulator of chromosome condensation (RCC1) repeat
MGSNEDGKLGLGLTPKELSHCASPRLIERIRMAKSIAVGLNHSLALARDQTGTHSKVYGWGQAEYGQIGMRLVNSNEPVEIRFESPATRVSKVVCGSRHSAFLTCKNTRCSFYV